MSASTGSASTAAQDTAAAAAAQSPNGILGELALMQVRRGKMPSDAGVLQGMSASVGSTALTGAATASIPVVTGSARGMAPSLAVNYSSLEGNGVFGQGFALDLMYVQRRTNRRIPRYDASDEFELGEVALARLAERDTTRIVDGVSYRVTAYARRTATAFERIEHWSGGADAADCWRTIDASGVITVYGVTQEARVTDPASSRRVFAWLPQARYDASGSAIAFGYKQEDDAGVPDVSYERNRQRSANRYPRSIAYGNEARFSPASPLALPEGPWHMELVFDYGEYDFSPGNDHPHNPVRPWAARELPYSDYSAGFERRTHRLCRTIALFHRFDQLGSEPVLTRTLSFSYDVAGSRQLVTHLVQAQNQGHRYIAVRPEGERYWTEAEPPVTFSYTAPDFAGAEFTPLLTQIPGVPPVADQARAYCLADLDGTGVAGIVYADSRSLLYWRPAADPADPGGPLRFEPLMPSPMPAERQVTGAFSLGDVNGDGRLSLIVEQRDRAGFYGRTATGQWLPFRAFEQRVSDSVGRAGAPGSYPPKQSPAGTPAGEQPDGSAAGAYAWADLTGNGLPDSVRVTDATVSYAPNLGETGFGALQRVAHPAGMPATVTPSARNSARFANVLGGGEQLVLLQSGSLTCWPSLGYGEFGEPVQPGGVPRFDDVPDGAVLLADLTGTGPADLVLLRPGQVEIYLNQGGNTFGPRPLTVPTPVATPGTLSVATVTADGRPSLVFSTGGQQPRHYALTLGAGTYPFLLAEADQGRGKRFRFRYSTSARMRLRDEASGQLWQLNMPFPVQVVEAIQQDDEIAAVRTTTAFRYRDGYFDPAERLFTGFARVDTTETEELLPAAEPHGAEPPAGVLPALTKTWFHVGTFGVPGLDQALEREYFSGDGDAYPMPGPDVDWRGQVPDGALFRQARLALAGMTRRVELYDADRPGVPYHVTQSEMSARLVAPPVDGVGAFLIHERESIGYAYERVPTDPAVRHEFTLDVDEFGNVLRGCQVFYRRRPGPPPLAGQDQNVVLATLREYLPPRDEPDLLLDGYLERSYSYSVTEIEPPEVRGLYYHLAQLATQVERALRHDSPADAELIAADRAVYEGADGGQAPPEPLAAPPRLRRRDIAAFTGTQIDDLLAGIPLSAPIGQFLTEQGGYAYEPGTDLWWQTGEATFYAAELFWQPRSVSDPIAVLDPARGSTRTLRYDQTAMALVETVLSANDGGLVDQRSTVELTDYQTVQAQRSRDPNGVITEVLYDPLGREFAAAFRGRVWVDGAAVDVGFPPLPVDDPASWPQPRDLRELADDPASFVGTAAAFSFHSTLGWPVDGTPVCRATVAAADYPQDVGPKSGGPPLLTISYFDGDGRPLQTTRRVDGEAADGPFRWAVADRVRYSGRGLPLHRYLPFFTRSVAFTAQAELDRTGIGPAVSYDPVDREIRTDFPRGAFPRAFYSTASYRSWSMTIADTDDTVTSSPYYRYYIDEDHDLSPHERDALIAAAAFDGTPVTHHLGILGSTVAVDQMLSRDEVLRSVLGYDAAGRLVTAADPRQAAAGRVNLTRYYGLTARPIMTASTDAGTIIALDDASGEQLISVDGRGVLAEFQRDALHRRTAVIVTEPTVAPITAERYLYGDTLDGTGATIYPNPAERGLLGQPCVRYDQAVRQEISARALTMEPLSVSESFAADIARQPDWQAEGWTTWAELFAALAPRLEAELFAASHWYGPLGSKVAATDPGGTTLTRRYNAAGELSAVDIAPPGAAAAPFVTDAGYDAAGQRRHVGYGDADGPVIDRTFRYDPASGWLTGVRSVRVADDQPLQDLTYVYDPAWNLSYVTDPAAPGAGGTAVAADLGYGYDALYRLTGATGRAVAAYGPQDAASGRYDGVYAVAPEGQLARYSAVLRYDPAGNCADQEFTIGQQAWSIRLTVAADSNRASVGDAFDPSGFDGSGNTLTLPAIPELKWDYHDQPSSVRYAAAATEYYAYDAAGIRRRRVTAGHDGPATDVRYFPALDIVREVTRDHVVSSEYQRVRVDDPDQSFGEVLLWTTGEPPPGLPVRQRRYLLDNLVGSAMLELAADVSMVSYEEYSPFGSTVFATGPSLAEVAVKAYRYTGCERDQATGLAYHGARYYAPWLCRWISPDPAGTVDGLNLYAYAANNPGVHLDPTGLNGKKNTIFGWTYTEFAFAATSTAIMFGAARYVMMRRFFTTAYRFHDAADPRTLLPNLAKQPKIVQDRVLEKMKDKKWAKDRAEAHMKGDVEESPYVSLTTDPVKAANTTDPWLWGIIWRQAPSLTKFRIPKSRITYPEASNKLSNSEGEVVFRGNDLEKYKVNSEANPFKDKKP